MSESVNHPAEQGSPSDPAASADPVTGDGTPTTGDDRTATDGGIPRRRGPRRAVRRGTEREAVPGVSADERSAGWGGAADGGATPGSGHGSNDEQLRRDVPPHWG